MPPFECRIVVTAPEDRASELHDAEPATFGAVHGRQLIKRHDAMGDTVQLKVRAFGGAIIQEQNCGLPGDKKLL